VLKGLVIVDSKVKAKFDADSTSPGSATVQVSFAGRDGSTQTMHCAAAPGGSCTTDDVVAGTRGKVTILVTSTGTGTLTCFVNGDPLDSDAIEGVTKWEYTVVDPPDDSQDMEAAK